MPEPLYRTSIVIWTDYNPKEADLEDLARDATSGDAYCTEQATVRVDPSKEQVPEGVLSFYDRLDEEAEEDEDERWGDEDSEEDP